MNLFKICNYLHIHSAHYLVQINTAKSHSNHAQRPVFNLGATAIRKSMTLQDPFFGINIQNINVYQKRNNNETKEVQQVIFCYHQYIFYIFKRNNYIWVLLGWVLQNVSGHAFIFVSMLVLFLLNSKGFHEKTQEHTISGFRKRKKMMIKIIKFPWFY